MSDQVYDDDVIGLNESTLVGFVYGRPAHAEKKGVTIIRFFVSVKERRRNYFKGKWFTKVTTHPVTAAGPVAYRMKDKLKAGTLVAIKGRLNHYFFTTESGEKRMVTDILADWINVISSEHVEADQFVVQAADEKYKKDQDLPDNVIDFHKRLRESKIEEAMKELAASDSDIDDEIPFFD